MKEFSFFAAGIPQPQGSARAFVNPRTGRAIVTTANPKMKPWREIIGAEARRVINTSGVDAVDVRIKFVMPRPKSSSPKRRPYPIVKPDIDKLTRACLDALTGIAYNDDSQVVKIEVQKVYALDGEQPGAHVDVALREPVRGLL